MRYHGNSICPDEPMNECSRRTAGKTMLLPTLSGGEDIKTMLL